MRVAAVMVFVLAGCFDGNDQVAVSISNDTEEARSFEVLAWWDAGDEPAQLGRATGEIAAGDSQRLFGFTRPCDEDQVGTVVYVGALGNGTSVVWEQDWAEGSCEEHNVVLLLEPAGARFNATFG